MRSLLVLCAACGGGSSTTDAKVIDTHAIDAPVDAPIDVPPPPIDHYHYVLDHMMVPQSNDDALMYGLDLNGDGTTDNQLGMVLAAFSGMGFDTQTATDQAVDTGAILTLVDVYADDFTTSVTQTITTYDGATSFPPPCNGSADTTCRHHLAGNGMFTEASAMDTPLTGTTVAGTFDAGPGHLEVELAPFGAPAMKLTLLGARARLVGTTATNVTNGILAGGVSVDDVHNKLEPAMQTAFTAVVQRDCCGLSTSPGGATCNLPTCGCSDGSSGATLLGLFDTSPKDCTISLSEVQNNTLIESLLTPDITVEDTMALSIGVGFTAVPGAFAP